MHDRFKFRAILCFTVGLVLGKFQLVNMKSNNKQKRVSIVKPWYKNNEKLIEIVFKPGLILDQPNVPNKLSVWRLIGKFARKRYAGAKLNRSINCNKLPITDEMTYERFGFCLLCPNILAKLFNNLGLEIDQVSFDV